MTDEDIMPFGKHAKKKLKDVPASYFHYLWFHGVKHEPNHRLHTYIKDMIPIFESENPDLIWE